MQKNKKNRLNKTHKLHLFGSFAWALVFFIGYHQPVNAASTSSSFIQSYNAPSSLQEGMIVQLQNNNANNVEPATESNIYRTFGVVVNLGNAAIAVENNSKTANQVFVANSGRYQVLVSDQNGTISTGDYITLSSVNGIGMKDNATEPIVVAQALGSFKGTGAILGTDNLKTSNGTQIVHIGLVSASISIGHNPLLSISNSGVPKILENLSKSIAGKTVSPWRIWLGVVVLLLVAIISGSMLFGAVRSSLISIGRNPLSKKAISKGFVEVVLLALIIFISAVFGVYLLLKV